MKNKILIISVILLGIIIFNYSYVFVLASDNDDDGIDDDFERINKRDLEIQYSTDRVEVRSILRSGETRDEIEVDIRYDDEGIEMEVSYESEYSPSSPEEFEIEFSVRLENITEFVDLDGNSFFNPDEDQIIQYFGLDNFKPVSYSTLSISDDTTLHYFVINTTDDVFAAHFFIAEEFSLINNSLLTPTQVKIDIEINDFNYLNDSSQLALKVELESESDYEEKEETEDEELGYAHDEKGVFSDNNINIGFFTWKEQAIVDGILRNVTTSPLETDENEQEFYMIYSRGTHIYHDPKIGIENVLNVYSQGPIPFFLIIVIVIICGISLSVVYMVYRYTESKKREDSDDNEEREILKTFKKETILNNPNLKAISPEFLTRINQFKWERNEKDQFIQEMLSLPPIERGKILEEMENRVNDR